MHTITVNFTLTQKEKVLECGAIDIPRAVTIGNDDEPVITGNPAVTGEADCDRNDINSDDDMMIVHDTIVCGTQAGWAEVDNESCEIENWEFLREAAANINAD